MVPERYRPLLALNPMAAMVDGFRAVAARRAAAAGRALDVGVARVLVVGRAGFVWFRRMERTLRGSRMTSPIVEARGVGKEYRLGARGGYRTPARCVSITSVTRAGALAARRTRRRGEPFWALDDVSFDIAAGRGASASSAATAPARARCSRSCRASPQPTRGEMRLRGRVAALLEVGHRLPPRADRPREHLPERRDPRDDARRDPPIVRRDRRLRRGRASSSTRRSSATRAACTCGSRSPSPRTCGPRSSSSTRCSPSATPRSRRSAWARCSDVATSGRTVLFVSHNMAAITRLCTAPSCLRERARRSRRTGRHASSATTSAAPPARAPSRSTIGPARPPRPATSTRACSPRASTATAMRSARRRHPPPVRVEIDYEVLAGAWPLHPNMHVYNEEGACVFTRNDSFDPAHAPPRAPRPLPRRRRNPRQHAGRGDVLGRRGDVDLRAGAWCTSSSGARSPSRSTIRPRATARAAPTPGPSRRAAAAVALASDAVVLDSRPSRSGSRMKVGDLCGGLGTRLREETEFRPKPLVEIGGGPILWHIMKIFGHHGLREFVLVPAATRAPHQGLLPQLRGA